MEFQTSGLYYIYFSLTSIDILFITILFYCRDVLVLVLMMPGVTKKSDMKFSLGTDRLRLRVSCKRYIPNIGGDHLEAMPPNKFHYIVVLPKP